MQQSGRTNNVVTDFQQILPLRCVILCRSWANRPKAGRADHSHRNSCFPMGIKPSSVLAKIGICPET